MQRKAFQFIESKVDKGARTIEGYASTFEPPERADSQGDIVSPGAFDATLAEDYPVGRIKLFALHDTPIGMPIELRRDERGLWIKARISETRAGDEALELAADGVLAEMSIGYEVVRSSMLGKVRQLEQVKLYELSLVPWGANKYARVERVTKAELSREALLAGLAEGIEFAAALESKASLWGVAEVVSAIAASRSYLESAIAWFDRGEGANEQLVSGAAEALQELSTWLGSQKLGGTDGN